MLPKQNCYGLGYLKRGERNKTEAAYENYLELQKRAGDILWYGFEAIKLRLANNCYYTPDFMVVRADGVVELHEVKGFWRDDARVKIKVAASQFPFKFLAVKKIKGGGWDEEAF